MLIAKPTKYGAGVTIYGDYYDLRSLHETIHFLIEGVPLTENYADFVAGLAYDIRHAYEGQREEVKFGFDELDIVLYKGESILWPIVLPQVNLLRWAASFHSTTREHQSNIFRLEYILQTALEDFDEKIGKKCSDWLFASHMWTNDFQTSFFSEMSKKYIFSANTGKKRFRNLPIILKTLNPISNEYKEFSSYLYNSAKEKKCNVDELVDLTEWLEFKW